MKIMSVFKEFSPCKIKSRQQKKKKKNFQVSHLEFLQKQGQGFVTQLLPLPISKQKEPILTNATAFP